MRTATRAKQRAGGHYRGVLGFLRHPVRKIEDEAHHLYEVEEAGESGETPFIAFLAVILFLLPIFLVVLILVFGAYELAG